MTTPISYREEFSDLPFEAILKTDLLRLGVHFTENALKACADAKAKSYFIFSFNRTSQEDLSALERNSAPEEFALIGGPFNLQRTIVSTRLHPTSPYKIDVIDDKLCLFFGEELLSEITLLGNPNYYQNKLSNGKTVSDIAPTIEWGYLIYLTAFRLCQYFGAEEECQFCDINHNYREQKHVGRPYTGIKSPEEILEALQIIHDLDHNKITQAYTVTGGSVLKELNGLKEADFYARYAEAIENKFPNRWIGKAVVQALPIDEVRTLKNAGYTIYHPNYEIWDAKLFEILCPGKTRYVGRDEWMKRIVDAAKIFGPENVIPNFVAGIEMAQPFGYTKVADAVRSTQEGLDYFMSQGICPRFTVWCVEPHTELSKTNTEPAPLIYYLELLRVYRETFRKYKLPVPPGYGEAGVGKAVFSVSAFMDVIGV